MTLNKSNDAKPLPHVSNPPNQSQNSVNLQQTHSKKTQTILNCQNAVMADHPQTPRPLLTLLRTLSAEGHLTTPDVQTLHDQLTQRGVTLLPSPPANPDALLELPLPAPRTGLYDGETITSCTRRTLTAMIDGLQQSGLNDAPAHTIAERLSTRMIALPTDGLDDMQCTFLSAVLSMYPGGTGRMDDSDDMYVASMLGGTTALMYARNDSARDTLSVTRSLGGLASVIHDAARRLDAPPTALPVPGPSDLAAAATQCALLAAQMITAGQDAGTFMIYTTVALGPDPLPVLVSVSTGAAAQAEYEASGCDGAVSGGINA